MAKITLELSSKPERLAEQCHLFESNAGIYTCPVEFFNCPFANKLACQEITEEHWLNVLEPELEKLNVE